MGLLRWLNPLNWFRSAPDGADPSSNVSNAPRASAAGLPATVEVELWEGDIHPVVDVEGIGPAYEAKLSKVGILRTDQLLAHDVEAIAAAIDVPVKRVRSWQAMSELALVDGIGPQYAEALARGGVDGVDDLAARDAEAIANEVNTYLQGLETTVTGGKVSKKRVATWQENARAMARGKVTVTLFGEALAPTAKQAVKDARADGATPAAGGTSTTGRGNAKTSTAATGGATEAASTTATSAKAKPNAAPKTAKASAPCAALTAAGNPCKRTARDGSKYCATHKGYRAPAAKKAPAKAAAPKATKTNGTAKAAAPSKAATPRRVHVTHNGYKLYQKGNRFYFSKKTQAEVRQDGAEPVYELPANREIKVTQNGLPVLKSK